MTNEELCVLAQGGDSDARDRLLLGIMPFIRGKALCTSRENSALLLEVEDMTHNFVVLFFRVLEKYKIEKGTLFLTYFSAAIKKRVAGKLKRKMKYEIPPWRQIGINEPVSEDDGSLTYAETVTYDISYTPEQIYLRKETIMEVREALERVSKREQAYLLYRFGFLDGEQHAQDETAKHFYLSLSRARNIEKTALRHMRRELHDNNDRPKKFSIQEIREPGRLIHEDFWIIHN